MGHVRLGVLSQSKRWRQIVELLETGGSVEEIARASATAAERSLASAANDDVFQYVARLLVELPLAARAPGFDEALADIGIAQGALRSLPELMAAISDAIDRRALLLSDRSDLGEMAQMALIESLSATLNQQLPTLFEPEPKEIRRALGQLSSGQRFAGFARSFFARLIHRSLDYYLSRELSNHVGPGERFPHNQDPKLPFSLFAVPPRNDFWHLPVIVSIPPESRHHSMHQRCGQLARSASQATPPHQTKGHVRQGGGNSGMAI